jgi:hypothetical protein
MDIAKNIYSQIDTGAKKTLANPYVMAIVKVTLVLYAAQIAPKLPTAAEGVFGNTFFKIFALMMMIYIAGKDFQLAIIMAIVYVVSVNVISGRGPLESFADFSKAYTATGSGKLIEPKTMLYPGCESLVLSDLEKVFDGDRTKLYENANYAYKELMEKFTSQSGKDTLTKIAYAAGLPYNRDFTDENAPYIGTILMYQGLNVSDTCKPPQ